MSIKKRVQLKLLFHSYLLTFSHLLLLTTVVIKNGSISRTLYSTCCLRFVWLLEGAAAYAWTRRWFAYDFRPQARIFSLEACSMLEAKPGSGLKHVPYGNLVRTSHRVMQIMRGLVAVEPRCICIVTQTSAATQLLEVPTHAIIRHHADECRIKESTFSTYHLHFHKTSRLAYREILIKTKYFTNFPE